MEKRRERKIEIQKQCKKVAQVSVHSRYDQLTKGKNMCSPSQPMARTTDECQGKDHYGKKNSRTSNIKGSTTSGTPRPKHQRPLRRRVFISIEVEDQRQQEGEAESVLPYYYLCAPTR